MISKMCFIFTVATATLLAGPHSALGMYNSRDGWQGDKDYTTAAKTAVCTQEWGGTCFDPHRKPNDPWTTCPCTEWQKGRELQRQADWEKKLAEIDSIRDAYGYYYEYNKATTPPATTPPATTPPATTPPATTRPAQKCKIAGGDDVASCQAGKWCNYDKVLISPTISEASGTGTVQECIAQCFASSDCGWVGYRHPTKDSPIPYCEFWKVGTTCKAPHPVPGHDVYRVRKSSCTWPAFFWRFDKRFPKEAKLQSDACTKGNNPWGSGECWHPYNKRCVDAVFQPEAGLLKAGEEEAELEPTAAAAATATSTATTASSPAEVARTVFGGIIATCCLYVAYRVGIGIHKPAVSKFPAPDYTNAEAEISEI